MTIIKYENIISTARKHYSKAIKLIIPYVIKRKHTKVILDSHLSLNIF